MPVWYFVKVPPLPPEISHQSNSVEVQKYLIKEGARVEEGTPLILLENYWATVQLRVPGQGIVKKLLFDPGTTVRIGDPIAIISADGEAVPQDKTGPSLEIVRNKRTKPQK
jgi:2-oxoglutarate dehydrogenase E2 component (dihydrolipoamide succinyltransferase)